MLKNSEERIILNDYIENDPLSEENLDKTLKYLHEIRLSCPNKTIWLYSGYTWDVIFNYETPKGLIKRPNDEILYDYHVFKRKQIISNCDVIVDGRYVDSERDITLAWRGSRNQRVIDVQKSLEQNKIVLWEN